MRFAAIDTFGNGHVEYLKPAVENKFNDRLIMPHETGASFLPDTQGPTTGIQTQIGLSEFRLPDTVRKKLTTQFSVFHFFKKDVNAPPNVSPLFQFCD